MLDQDFGHRSAFGLRPGEETDDQRRLVDHARLEGEEAEEEVARGVGSSGHAMDSGPWGMARRGGFSHRPVGRPSMPGSDSSITGCSRQRNTHLRFSRRAGLALSKQDGRAGPARRGTSEDLSGDLSFQTEIIGSQASSGEPGVPEGDHGARGRHRRGAEEEGHSRRQGRIRIRRARGSHGLGWKCLDPVDETEGAKVPMASPTTPPATPAATVHAITATIAWVKRIIATISEVCCRRLSLSSDDNLPHLPTQRESPNSQLATLHYFGTTPVVEQAPAC